MKIIFRQFLSYIGHDAFDYSTIEHIHFPENLDGIGTPTLYDKNGGRITAPSEIAGSDFQRQFDYLVKVESKLPPADQGHEGNNPGSPNNAMTAAIIAIIVILGILVSYVVVKKRQ